MKLIPTKCQQCSATISISPEQKHARCEHCGSQYVIDWGNQSHPGLTKFETVLSRIVDTTTFLAADRRLTYLEGDIQRIRDELSARQGTLQTVQATGNNAIQAIKKQVSDVEMGMGVAGAIAVLAFILLFSTDKPAFLGFALLAILFTGGAYMVKRSVQARIHPRQMEMQAAVISEEQEVIKIQRRLDDLLLEKELCQKTAGKYRFSEK